MSRWPKITPEVLWRHKKIRIRTDAELESQRMFLRDLAQRLEEREFPYVLASGTLLGIFRDGDLIPWDWDLQLYFRTEDLLPRLEDFVSLLKSMSLSITRNEVVRNTQEIKVVALLDDIKLEVTSWTLLDDFRVRRASQLPAHLFEDVAYINFCGTKLRTFGDPKEFLQWSYGDWETPMRTAQKSAYLSRQFMTKNDARVTRKVFNFIVRLIGKRRASVALSLSRSAGPQRFSRKEAV